MVSITGPGFMILERVGAIEAVSELLTLRFEAPFLKFSKKLMQEGKELARYAALRKTIHAIRLPDSPLRIVVNMRRIDIGHQTYIDHCVLITEKEGEYLAEEVVKRKFIKGIESPQRIANIEEVYSFVARLDHPSIFKPNSFIYYREGRSKMRIIEKYVPYSFDLYLNAILTQKITEDKIKVVFSVFRDVTLAADYLHKMGYIHRDIKADNVLIENGLARLIDFEFKLDIEDMYSKIKEERAFLKSKYPQVEENIVYQRCYQAIKGKRFEPALEEFNLVCRRKKMFGTIEEKENIEKTYMQAATYLEEWESWAKVNILIMGTLAVRHDSYLGNVPPESNQRYVSTAIDKFAIGTMIDYVIPFFNGIVDGESYDKLFKISQDLIKEEHWKRPELEDVARRIQEVIDTVTLSFYTDRG